MTTLKEKIEIMQAALDGKEIEFNIGQGWQTATATSCGEPRVVWAWDKIDYRIKPEKRKPRVFELRELDYSVGNAPMYGPSIRVQEVLPR